MFYEIFVLKNLFIDYLKFQFNCFVFYQVILGQGEDQEFRKDKQEKDMGYVCFDTGEERKISEEKRILEEDIQ